MHSTDEGTEFIDILFVTPEKGLDFCCEISSTDYDPDAIPTARIFDKSGKKYLGVIRMDHKPENENDFDEVDERIPEDIVKAFFSFISLEKNWDNFISEWDSMPEHYELKDQE